MLKIIEDRKRQQQERFDIVRSYVGKLASVAGRITAILKIGVI